MIHQIMCTGRFLNQHKELASTIYIWTTNRSSRLFLGTPWIASSSAEHNIFQTLLELHSAQPRVTFLPNFPVILLYFVLYIPLFTSRYIPNFTSSNMEPTPSQVRNHYSQKNQETHVERALAHASQKTANLDCRSNVCTSSPAFEYSVQDS